MKQAARIRIANLLAAVAIVPSRPVRGVRDTAGHVATNTWTPTIASVASSVSACQGAEAARCVCRSQQQQQQQQRRHSAGPLRSAQALSADASSGHARSRPVTRGHARSRQGAEALRRTEHRCPLPPALRPPDRAQCTVPSSSCSVDSAPKPTRLRRARDKLATIARPG